jgi:hypothetical protein
MTIPFTHKAFEDLLMEDSERGMKAVGRALIALTELQTEYEQRTYQSRNLNHKGFNAVDARIGMDNANHFRRFGYLQPVQLRYWRKKDKFGNVRICKYIEQLIIIAKRKAGYVEKQQPQAVQLSLPL